MIEVKFTCADAHEFKQLLSLLTAGNEEAASAYEDAPVTEPKQPTVEEIAEVKPAQNEPEQPTAEDPAGPVVTLQDLQTLGRKLAAAGKGVEVQAILKAHNVRLISRIPESERAEVLAQMQEVQ